MKLLSRVALAAAVTTATVSGATAQSIIPGRPGPAMAGAPCLPCPPGALPMTPGAPVVPYVPGQPSVPLAPSTPGQPESSAPTPTPNAQTPPPPTTPPQAPSPTPQPRDDRQLTQATSQGTGNVGAFTPSVVGDLLGGGVLPGPIFVRTAPNGQILGGPITFIQNGQRVALTNVNQTPRVDEPLLGRPAPIPANIAPGGTAAVLPPPGAVFAPELANRVSRIPQVNRGAFKVTENENVRPMTRAYVSYYYYDQVFGSLGDVPRISVHQEVFGYEQAFADNLFSVGLRLPYNQVVSDGFYNKTALGDLTIVAKAVLLENRETGNLLSGGLVVTTPTAGALFPNTLTGETIRTTYLQPFLGYLYNHNRVFVQGFSSILVPTDRAGTTFLANDIAIGYQAYLAPGSFLSAVIPFFETHVNTPLENRSVRGLQNGFPDQVTLLGGLHTFFGYHTVFTGAVGAPVTGPRPFSLQATAQLAYRF